MNKPLDRPPVVVNVDDLLGFRNYHMPRYEGLYEAEFRNMVAHRGTPYFGTWYDPCLPEMYPDGFYGDDSSCSAEVTRDFFRGRLEGRVLVDCGGNRDDTMLQFAKDYGASMYINVDRFLPYSVEERFLGRFPGRVEMVDGMQIVRVNGDMLCFLARLQPGTVNVVINGINDSLIENLLYHHALLDEIGRVVGPNGLFFGYDSVVLDLVASNSSRVAIRFVEKPCKPGMLMRRRIFERGC